MRLVPADEIRSSKAKRVTLESIVSDLTRKSDSKMLSNEASANQQSGWRGQESCALECASSGATGSRSPSIHESERPSHESVSVDVMKRFAPVSHEGNSFLSALRKIIIAVVGK